MRDVRGAGADASLRIEKAGQRTYISGSEKQILEKFWEFFESDSRFITFNGRQFDGPFLMIRSAINGIVPKRDLVGYRYGFHPNCDLREALNFFGTDERAAVQVQPRSRVQGLRRRDVEGRRARRPLGRDVVSRRPASRDRRLLPR